MLEHRKRFYSYLIILISLFILIFWTRNLYYSIQEHSDEWEIFKTKIIKEKESLTELQAIISKINKNEKDIKGNLDKYLIHFDEKELLKYLYDYAENNNLKPRSISFSEWSVGDLWFKLWQVNLSIWFPNEASMLKFIGFVIDKNAKYTFFLDSFSYPDFWSINKINTNKQMTFNLKIYYK